MLDTQTRALANNELTSVCRNTRRCKTNEHTHNDKLNRNAAIGNRGSCAKRPTVNGSRRTQLSPDWRKRRGSRGFISGTRWNTTHREIRRYICSLRSETPFSTVARVRNSVFLNSFRPRTPAAIRFVVEWKIRLSIKTCRSSPRSRGHCFIVPSTSLPTVRGRPSPAPQPSLHIRPVLFRPSSLYRSHPFFLRAFPLLISRYGKHKLTRRATTISRTK